MGLIISNTHYAQDDIGKANYDLPQASQAVPASPNDSLSKTNGNVGTDEKARWERVGWAPRFGSGETEEEEATLADHQTWLEGKLDDKFYGGMHLNTHTHTHQFVQDSFKGRMG